MDSLRNYLDKFSAYFGELRRRLLSVVRVFGISFIIGFLLAAPLIKFFVKYMAIKNVVIVTSSPFQLLDLSMSIAFFFATVIVTPLIVYHLYAFLRSGLRPQENRIFLSLIPVALILFFFGFSYGFATLYMAMKMIAQVNLSLGVVNYWDIGRFAAEIMLTSSLLGLIFEFPIIITFFIRAGFTTADFLRSKRRHAVVLIFIFVSLLPPTDGLSLVLMAAPLVAIYEVTILLNSRKKRRILLA